MPAGMVKIYHLNILTQQGEIFTNFNTGRIYNLKSLDGWLMN